MPREPWDAIVIGSGAAGGWAAKELCERGLRTLFRFKIFKYALAVDADDVAFAGRDTHARPRALTSPNCHNKISCHIIL